MADSIPSRIQLEIATPEKQVVREPVEAVTLPGKEGYLGVLPGHAPLLSELQPGEIVYTTSLGERYLAVSWGFAEVLPERVIVLAETSELAGEIDVARAERAKERAEERLKRPNEANVDAERARSALARSMARLRVASHRTGGDK
ncbi:MAG: F0F1 ATP synthase subunit epsilon [Terriglobia bacterium]